MRFISILVLLSALVVEAQESKPAITFGLEQDVLPYVFNGYFANVWVGKGHVRSRLLFANVHKPDFMVTDPFTNNRVSALAVTMDYFLKTDWKGWWISGGGVLWKNSLQTNLKQQTAHFNTVLINGSLGYSWKIYQHFYISPWAGVHLRVGGDQTVTIDNKIYTPPFFNPEASIKVGWYF